MVRGEQGAALRHLELLFDVGTIGSLPDRQLLEQFRSRPGDLAEDAFRCLVERHGPLVLRTCRSILRDEHAAEDAFQATFLVLVRRARSLWVRDSLGPWLFQVATRVSASARAAQIRRRQIEQRADRTQTAADGSAYDDLAPAIQQELACLPVQFRDAVVLCCIEGLTQQQAAGQLGCPLGTLQSRLARGANDCAIDCCAGDWPPRALCLPQCSRPNPHMLPFPTRWQTRRSGWPPGTPRATSRKPAPPHYRYSCSLKES